MKGILLKTNDSFNWIIKSPTNDTTEDGFGLIGFHWYYLNNESIDLVDKNYLNWKKEGDEVEFDLINNLANLK